MYLVITFFGFRICVKCSKAMLVFYVILNSGDILWHHWVKLHKITDICINQRFGNIKRILVNIHFLIVVLNEILSSFDSKSSLGDISKDNTMNFSNVKIGYKICESCNMKILLFYVISSSGGKSGNINQKNCTESILVFYVILSSGVYIFFVTGLQLHSISKI